MTINQLDLIKDKEFKKIMGKIYRLTHDGQQVGPPRVWAD